MSSLCSYEGPFCLLVRVHVVPVPVQSGWVCDELSLPLWAFSDFHQLCGNIINKAYCDNYFIIKLACSDTTASNIYGLVATCLTIACPVSLIIYTYVKILTVCFSGSKQTRQKAIQAIHYGVEERRANREHPQQQNDLIGKGLLLAKRLGTALTYVDK
ncbi:Olfactory receptor 52K1 [Liparis tanakae]|uniref:Olfactory receptor 52K1 n=1 Tax=Liparis tanakae TaxID=230148 RepID=A0A4Z2EUA7_9TELE|nr:Olfactory receptor 52K1 [Liparis tanakae]